MKNYLLEHSELPGKEMSERLGIDRTRLYRGVSPTYGPPPPFEAVWRPDKANTTALLQQIAELYHRSGLAESPEAHERLDYIGIELAFIEYLASEEAGAWEAGDVYQPGNCSVARLNLSTSILPFGFRRLLPKPWNSRRRISIAAIWVCSRICFGAGGDDHGFMLSKMIQPCGSNTQFIEFSPKGSPIVIHQPGYRSIDNLYFNPYASNGGTWACKNNTGVIPM